MFAYNSKTKSRRKKNKIGRKVVRATADIPHELQGSEGLRSRSPGRSGWLFKSPLAGAGAILWRPHYRPHSMFLMFFGNYTYLVSFPRNSDTAETREFPVHMAVYETAGVCLIR